MPKIVDNIEVRAEDELLDSLASSYQLDAAIGYFNLRGWGLLAAAVDALPERDGQPKARLLVGMHESPVEEMRRLARRSPIPPVDNATAARMEQDANEDYRLQLQVGAPTAEDERALRKLLHQIESGTVHVKLHLAHRLHAKLYLCHREDTAAPRVAYVGSSNLTTAGLREQGELNVDVVEGDATQKLARWFEDRWNDPFSVDAVPELIEVLKESWVSEQPLDPYLVYLKMAYHLSREAREGLVEYGLPASMRNQLLEFQAAAVKIAARIVMQKGGAMIADVVGLGKTIAATAVARLLQEEQGFETLVICPKNLTDMWESYLHRYEVRGKVESLSMVHKVLPEIRRHRLVIVDEAHNLRSDKRRDYRAVKDYISDNDSRVLLLSATPYNKQLGDLAAQLALFLRPDADLGVRPERAIEDVGEVDFTYQCDGKTSSLAAFKQSECLEDWQGLMSQYMVRRTRRFVEDHYARTDEHGRRYLTFGSGEPFYFPERKPAPVDWMLTEDDPSYEMTSDDTLDTIRDLRLPRYQLGYYIDETFAPADDAERKLVEDLQNSYRGNLSGFTRITMFKRLSSSGPAFVATLRRHRLRNLLTLHALENGLEVPIGSVDNSLWAAETDQDPEDADEADGGDGAVLFEAASDSAADAYERLSIKRPGTIRWAPSHMFGADLADDLRADADAIGGLLDRFGDWQAERDGKIAALMDVLTKQHPAAKVLVFTEAADTARYVANELEHRGISDVGLVTGDTESPMAVAQRFSPMSNEMHGEKDAIADELRVLVSTDVLSEGQNLQDAHVVVNYDLPWAIVKLVQRAGRVDRIGQRSEQVHVVSLMPDASVEAEIELRSRVLRRLGENAQLLGSDEAFFGDPSELQAIAGVFDESSHAGSGDEDGPDDVDPVSMAYEIWRHALEADDVTAARVAALPNVVYATKRRTAADGTGGGDGPQDALPNIGGRPQDAGSGVVVHTQTHTGADAFAFVDADGTGRRITPQEALRLAEAAPHTPSAPRLDGHHELVAHAVASTLRTPTGHASGALQGVRGKVWKRFHNGGANSFAGTIWATQAGVESALDTLNARPLTESATQLLARALRERNDEDLAALLVDLHDSERLCVPAIPHGADPEPAIVCSMGLRVDSDQ
ncbi:SNF2-related protein [Candidatus Poriferisodalis sp.]|uniref:SNF2-related protein n=1 Tax=Candidatus Poriferisodalis sp. TaxID=3101277 RepID=UPI003B01F8CE